MENQEKIERRTFGGANAMDGYAGFRVGQSYQLRYTVLESGEVSIELDHAQEGVGPLVMPFAQFKTWFTKD
ncbi:hypothetical protein QMK33_19645 [Hymenobacter sp. H14-R3]|uniref:hypothetical protein n=1 Tax=Hymenobacter sp. H14-R3 TaxID=3046308 RepID=UPI0024B91B0D|nr:hypothetical protein [Hymenobacter sp. H14-R3]MDJ0367368.1 hypothetical protein [Hymenobacter sp. H14-R3]